MTSIDVLTDPTHVYQLFNDPTIIFGKRSGRRHRGLKVWKSSPMHQLEKATPETHSVVWRQVGTTRTIRHFFSAEATASGTRIHHDIFVVAAVGRSRAVGGMLNADSEVADTASPHLRRLARALEAAGRSGSAGGAQAHEAA